MNKKLYLIVFLGFLASSFYPYNKSNFVISANKKLVNDTVKALTKEDIMGKYIGRLGSPYFDLTLKENSFKQVYAGCTSEMIKQGKWIYSNDTLRLTDISINIFDTIVPTTEILEYILVRYDSLLLLVEKDYDKENLDKSYQEICKLHNTGINIMHSNFVFLHKKLENHAPVPIPTVPTEYHNFLLKKPVTCEVITIENDTTLTINVGKKDGVFEGLQLHKKIEFEKEKKQKHKKRQEYDEENRNPLFLTFEVVSCETHTSIIKPIVDFEFLIVEKAKKLQVGDTLCSKICNLPFIK